MIRADCSSAVQTGSSINGAAHRRSSASASLCRRGKGRQGAPRTCRRQLRVTGRLATSAPKLPCSFRASCRCSSLPTWRRQRHWPGPHTAGTAGTGTAAERMSLPQWHRASVPSRWPARRPSSPTDPGRSASPRCPRLRPCTVANAARRTRVSRSSMAPSSFRAQVRLNGSWQIGLSVNRAMALAKAGASGGRPGSPMPAGASAQGTMWTSKCGTRDA